MCSKRGYFIRSPDNKLVGEIYNLYNGICYETFTKADKYGIRFPEGCTKEHKLILIQATVFLDYLQYAA